MRRSREKGVGLTLRLGSALTLGLTELGLTVHLWASLSAPLDLCVRHEIEEPHTGGGRG